MKHRALFLDRDGTLIHPTHYPSRAENLLLYEHIGPHLLALQNMGFLLIVITNQSGIARGYFTEADLQCMHEHLISKLAFLGVRLTAVYYCPHHPEGVIPELAKHCNCRKPQSGMLFQAANEFNLDLQLSWFVGDTLDDVEAGNHAGCFTVLVDLASEAAPTSVVRSPHFVARDTLHALRLIQVTEWLRSDLDFTYRPTNW